MKHIKSYKIFESIDIHLKWKLSNFNISNYIINEDGSIDCNQYITLRCKNLNEIPFKFNKINDHFDIAMNKLISLKNCPKYVEREFNCLGNKLTSLEFGPEYVGSNYYCFNNNLITLKGCVEEVYDNFSCSNNKLKSLEFCPMQIEGTFNCSDNQLEYLDRSPLIKGNLYCQNMFRSEPEFNGYCKKLFWEEQ